MLGATKQTDTKLAGAGPSPLACSQLTSTPGFQQEGVRDELGWLEDRYADEQGKSTVKPYGKASPYLWAQDCASLVCIEREVREKGYTAPFSKLSEILKSCF